MQKEKSKDSLFASIDAMLLYDGFGTKGSNGERCGRR